MAKCVSTNFSSMRGSIAGITYLTTPQGQIIARQRTRPVNTPTDPRNFVKNAFEFAVEQWSAISVPKQAQWNAWALAHASPKSGRQVMISGSTIAAWLTNASLFPAGSLHISAFVPEFVALPAIQSNASAYTVALSTGVRFSVKNLGAIPVVVIVELSQGLGYSRNYWKGPWDTTKTVATAHLAGASHDYDFSGLIAGQKYFARIRALTNGTTVGQVGTLPTVASILSSIAVTVP